MGQDLFGKFSPEDRANASINGLDDGLPGLIGQKSAKDLDHGGKIRSAADCEHGMRGKVLRHFGRAGRCGDEAACCGGNRLSLARTAMVISKFFLITTKR